MQKGSMQGLRLLTLSAALITTLASCGFHLRGSPALDHEAHGVHNTRSHFTASVQLVYPNRERAWATQLIKQLERARITVIDQHDAPPLNSDLNSNNRLMLELISSTQNRRIASYTSRAKAAEYTLTERLTYQITHPNGREVVPTTTLSSERVYQFNVNNISGKDQEAHLISRELKENIGEQLIRHLFNTTQRLTTGEQSSTEN